MQVEGDRWQVAGGRWQVAGGHLIIGPVGEVGWVHLVLALGAGEALPVVGPWAALLLAYCHILTHLAWRSASPPRTPCRSTAGTRPPPPPPPGWRCYLFV